MTLTAASPVNICSHLFYDRMTSLLAPYENSEAVEVAKALDRKVESVR